MSGRECSRGISKAFLRFSATHKCSAPYVVPLTCDAFAPAPPAPAAAPVLHAHAPAGTHTQRSAPCRRCMPIGRHPLTALCTHADAARTPIGRHTYSAIRTLPVHPTLLTPITRQRGRLHIRPTPHHALCSQGADRSPVVAITVYEAAKQQPEAAFTWACPGLSRLPLPPARQLRLPRGWTARKLRQSVVVGVRLTVGGTAAGRKADLPYIAGVGLYAPDDTL